MKMIDPIKYQTAINIYDRLAIIIKEERLSNQIQLEFKELIIDLEKRFDLRVAKELFFRQYFKDLSKKEKEELDHKLWRLRKKLNIQNAEGIRYYSQMEHNRREGRTFLVKRKEILTYFYINIGTGTDTDTSITTEKGVSDYGN